VIGNLPEESSERDSNPHAAHCGVV
jgi:hypothetical protein